MVWMALILAVFPAAADEGEDAGVNDMLEAIPEIVAPVDPDAKPKKPKIAQGMDLDGYYQECQVAVYKYFKAPKKAVRELPTVEVTFVVKIDAEGYITGVSAPSLSGFKSFDAAALKALNKVGKLPAPPVGWNPAVDKVLVPFTATSGR